MNKRKTYSVIGENIVIKRRDKTILDNVNIFVEKQSIYALLGENDAGKSVLLTYLVDCLKSDRGGDATRSASGNVNAGTTTAAGRPSCGFSPQNFHVLTEMRILELLCFVAAVNGLTKDHIVDRYENLASVIGLPESDQLVNRLRHTQKKVLSFVLAIIHEPELIILDDITSGMDTKTLKVIWTLLSHINESRECTIIVSASNNFCFMKTAITHIGIMMNGKIVEEGLTKNLMKKYKSSNIEDLLVEIILTEDDQRNPSAARAVKTTSIKSSITLDYTSPLNSIFTTDAMQDDTPKKRGTTCVVLGALIMKNIRIMAGINLALSLAVLVCRLLFPLVVHAAFARYPHRSAVFGVQNAEKCDPTATIPEAMSCAFYRHYLAKSFELKFLPTDDNDAFIQEDVGGLLTFNSNYTVALQRRIERKITNGVDFENSQILLRAKIYDGRTAAHVREKFRSHYREFLLDYAHNKLTEYVTDINYESIKYHYMSENENDEGYHIYERFVNSGLVIYLAFFVHASIAVWLRLQDAGDEIFYGEWTMYLSRLAVHLPIAVVWDLLLVAQLSALYNIRTYYGYVFLCLFLESTYGIHLGYVLCSFVKNYVSNGVILYLKLSICVYVTGLWWPTNGLFPWIHTIIHYTPLSTGVCFIRNVIEKQYFVPKSLFIIFCWTAILVIITVVDISITKNVKFYNNLRLYLIHNKIKKLI